MGCGAACWYVGCGAACGAGAGAGADAGAAAAGSSVFWCKKFFTILFANSMGYSCMMVLSTKSPICIRNAIFTNVPPRNGAISEPLWYSVKSMRLDSGGLMSMVSFSIVERDVDAEPII